MNKSELIAGMAEQTGLSKKDCGSALDAALDLIGGALKADDKVQLAGFGSFAVKERAARVGRNPATRESIQIPASKAPVFKAGKALKDLVQ